MKTILFTNDDGYDSEMLHDLFEYARYTLTEYKTLLIAPHTNCSGISHAITLEKPIIYRNISPDKYSLEGYPADCSIIGRNIFGYQNLIISGPNAGANLGQDIIYSGTVAAARENALHNIPALAFSFVDDNYNLETIDYDQWHRFLDKWLLPLIQLALQNSGYIINVNITFPITLNLEEASFIGRRHYYNYQFTKKEKDHKGEYYEVIPPKKGVNTSKTLEENSDVDLVSKGKNIFTVLNPLPKIETEKMQELLSFMEK